MTVIVDDQGESAPIKLDTLAKLERAYNRVMRENVRNRPRRGEDFFDNPIRKGVLHADMTRDGGAVTVSCFESNADGDEADSGMDVEAYPWMLSADDTIAAGTEVVVSRIGRRWYVTNAGCEAAEAPIGGGGGSGHSFTPPPYFPSQFFPFE